MASASGSGVKLVSIEQNREEVVEEPLDRGRVVAGQYALVRTIFTYLEQPSEYRLTIYRLTIYRQANIGSFSKYR